MITKDNFINYFRSGIKETNDCGIGIEHEKFLFWKIKGQLSINIKFI